MVALRDATIDDATLIAEVHSEEWLAPLSTDEQRLRWAKEWLADDEQRYWVVLADDEEAGYCCLKDRSERPELGVMLLERACGKANGPAAVRAVESLCRDEGLPGLRASVDPTNVRSWKMFDRLGWRFVGTTRSKRLEREEDARAFAERNAEYWDETLASCAERFGLEGWEAMAGTLWFERDL